ncbi:MAG: hypothetical protein WKG32_05905 [Gemmatimonadaceae bacterium]
MSRRGFCVAPSLARGIAPGIALGVALLAAPARGPAAQMHAHPAPAHGDSAATTFLAAARSATARYRELAQAVADGYRRIGGDLPSMGEHWVNPSIAVRDAFAPDAPSVLIYVRVAGNPVLAGVAYTRFLARDAPYPAFPAGVPHAWHEHNGSVADETLPLGHGNATRPPAGDTRVAVLHAWEWIANPAGVWNADNWALPYIRLGLRPADAPGADAKALALASGGDAYYLNAIVTTGEPDAEETERMGAILARTRARAEELVRDKRAGDPVEPARAASLGALWQGMWDEIARDVRPEVAARLRPLRELLR